MKINGEARLRHFKAETFPHINNLQLDCGKCGNRRFEVYVEPQGSDARVVGIVCCECRDVWKLDLGAFLDGKGKARRVGLSDA